MGSHKQDIAAVARAAMPRKPKQCITRADAFRFAAWIERNKTFVATHDWDDIQEAASAELKLIMSRITVVNICHDLGIGKTVVKPLTLEKFQRNLEG